MLPVVHKHGGPPTVDALELGQAGNVASTKSSGRLDEAEQEDESRQDDEGPRVNHGAQLVSDFYSSFSFFQRWYFVQWPDCWGIRRWGDTTAAGSNGNSED